MHKEIKDAYNGINLDETAKQRILDKLNVTSGKKEERRDKLISKEYQEDKNITEAVILKEKKRFPRVVALVASMAAVVGLVVAIGYSAKGILVGPNTSSVGTTITTTPKPTSVATPKATAVATPKATAAATPKATATATPKAEGEKITISRKEFEAGIERMANAEFGVADPYVIYASSELVIINDGNGMLFYDYKNGKCLGVLDTMKYDISHIQGSNYTEVKVSESGQYISFANVDNEEIRYLFDLKNLTLEKGKTLGDMPVYDKIGCIDEETDLLIKNKPAGRSIFGIDYGVTEDGTYVLCQVQLPDNYGDVTLTLSELKLISLTLNRKADGTKSYKLEAMYVFPEYVKVF